MIERRREQKRRKGEHGWPLFFAWLTLYAIVAILCFSSFLVGRTITDARMVEEIRRLESARSLELDKIAMRKHGPYRSYIKDGEHLYVRVR